MNSNNNSYNKQQIQQATTIASTSSQAAVASAATVAYGGELGRLIKLANKLISPTTYKSKNSTQQALQRTGNQTLGSRDQQVVRLRRNGSKQRGLGAGVTTGQQALFGLKFQAPNKFQNTKFFLMMINKLLKCTKQQLLFNFLHN